MKQTPEPLLVVKNRSKIYQGRAQERLPILLPEGRPVVVVTDENLAATYPELIGERPCCRIGRGEAIKNLATVERLIREVLSLGVDRSWFVLAIGGGIVCDVAGFVASTYMRGLPFGFLPTSLLAQVDASVGGKNGVNIEGYKNMIGTFTQPDFVLCDASLLRSLPEREFRAGLAEVVKTAIIGDAGLFVRLEENPAALTAASESLLEEVVARAVRVKATIVERDERERGERRLLNLGHTFAHAIEKCCGRYNHGEAVAIGLGMATRVAVRRGVLTDQEAERIVRLLQALGLPLACEVPLRDLVAAMARDKKGEGDRIAVILPSGIGQCEIAPMTLSEIEAMGK